MRDCDVMHAEALEPRRLLSVAFDGSWTSEPDGLWSALSVLVADMNGDGKADVVIGHVDSMGTYGLEARLSNGDGTFSSVPAVFSGSAFNVGALGDFDGDGDIDAIVGDALALNNGAGLLTQQPPDALLAGSTTFAAVDSDGDGRAELAVKSGTTLRLLSLQSGVFTPISSLEADARLVLNGSASVIDLTGDGRPDLVLRADGADPFTLLVFNESSSLVAGPQLAGRAVLADVTGDGIADHYTFSPYPEYAVYVSPGLGNGSFGSPQHRGYLSFDSTVLLEVPDINSDGIPDLLYQDPNTFAYTQSIPCLVMLGDSAGRYTSATVASGFGYNSRTYGTTLNGVADFDGDGRLDLWATHSYVANGLRVSVGVSRQITGASLTSFTVSKTQILPMESAVLSATVLPGDPEDSFSPSVTFYIDLDGNGLVSPGDTRLGAALGPDPDGVFRYTFNRVETIPIGAFSFLAVAGTYPTTLPPTLAPVVFLGPAISGFTVSAAQIHPLDSIVLSATVVHGDLGVGPQYVTFYIDEDGDGLVSASDTQIGRVFTPDSSGVFRSTYDHLRGTPIGPAMLLAVTTLGSVTSPPLSSPVTFFGLSIASFTVSETQIRPLDSVELSATVVQGDLGTGDQFVTFYIDEDRDGLVSAPDTQIGQALTPDSDGVYRSTYKHTGVNPIGSALLLAVTTLGSTSSPPLSSPVTFWTRLFFPEGFRNDATVNEYLSMVNPLDHAVQYQLIARYETGERDQVIATGTLAAFSRGGVTICERGVAGSGLTRPGVGYALELQADGPLGATFAHYDSTFGSDATRLASGGAGETLAAGGATRWAYADLSTVTFDFLTFYNITDQDASVQIRFYDDDQGSVVYSMTIPALRRGGVALRDVASLLPGHAYAAVVTSNVEIAAAHSRYRADGRAWSAAAAGVVDAQLFPGVESQPGAVNTLSLFNTDSAPVEITLTTAYDVGEARTRSILVLARQRLSLNPFEGAPAGAMVVSVRLTDLLGSSSGGQQAVVAALSVDDAARGDIISSAPAPAARTVWAFGDAFLARGSAGTTEFESLFVYNASDAVQRVMVRFLFTDGTFADREMDVAARAPARMVLEDQSVITDHAPNTWYGIMVYGEGMIVASLTHWDLSQGGGWSTLGTPQGLVGAV